jgi:DNA-binding NarL/FixJ family response regulator
MTSVVIVADSGAEMARLTAAVKALRGMEIVRYASGRTSVARTMAAHAPSLVLIAEMSSRQLTLERLIEIRAASPQSTVIVLAEDAGSRWLGRALRAGATAVLPGALGGRALGAVLEEVMESDTAPATPVAQAA